MQCDFQASIACLSRHGVRKTALWIEKLESVGVAEARRILSGEGVEAISLCPILLTGQGGKASETADANRRRISQAQAVGAKSVVAITGGLSEGDLDLAAARERAVEALIDIVPDARAAGIRIALEPLHPAVCGYRSVISTIDDAMAMIASVRADDVMGLAVDTYALWWDSRLGRQIADAGRHIVNFHVSDWLRETRDVRLDRGMPGDGLIDNRGIREMVEKAGYDGAIEVEILSRLDWWARDPDEVVRTIVARFGSDF